MKRTIKWTLLIALALLLTLPVSAAYDLPQTEKIIYGYSGEGRALEAYRFGNGKNVMVVTFALHGYEDNWKQDGLALVYTAQQVMDHLQKSYLPDTYDWTVYILPCCNPDGLYSGYTCNGPGRCTTTYITADGTVAKGKGVDMNRSFPSGFAPYSSSRNYTTSKSLACLESRALATFIQKVKGSQVNILIDVHGWLKQIITNSSRLRTALSSNFPNSKQTYVAGGSGYLSTYANSLGYEAALLEFPPYYSMSAFRSSPTAQRMINAVDAVLQSVPLACDQNGHQYVLTESGEPTCTQAGFAKETCSLCGKEKVTTVAALGHAKDPNNVNILSAPTAARSGTLQYTCTRCGHSGITETLPCIFDDVDANGYYADALDMCYAAGYINGTSDTKFSPDMVLSRAMLVTILYRFHAEPQTDVALPFTDVQAGAFYENAVKWAYANGVVNGTSATTFSPSDPVTRQETMTIFFRYVKFVGMDNGQREELSFQDNGQLDAFAWEAAQWSVANGIIMGVSSTKLDPRGCATRAQSVTIVQRVASYLEQYQHSE